MPKRIDISTQQAKQLFADSERIRRPSQLPSTIQFQCVCYNFDKQLSRIRNFLVNPFSSSRRYLHHIRSNKAIFLRLDSLPNAHTLHCKFHCSVRFVFVFLFFAPSALRFSIVFTLNK